jgi:sarcosine oxidase
MADVIVIGLGAMGSAAAMHLAKRGARVVGFDQFGPAHDQGSSHGESRLIRQAYFESPAYVPLLKRAYTLWEELEAAAKRPLFMRTGLMLVGRRTGVASAIAREHDIRIDELAASEIRARVPSLRVGDDLVGLFEPGAGWLAVEACVQAHLDQAARAHADLHFGESVASWKVDDASGEVQVVTSRGTYRADKLVIAGGAWSSSLLGPTLIPLQVHRVVQLWFEADPTHDAPCFAFDLEDGFFYGFPKTGGRVKVAEHCARDPVSSPSEVRREVSLEDARRVESFVKDHLPRLRLPHVTGKTCMYTMTPDEHFVIDLDQQHPQVAFAAGFSGHGFKFSSVVGEILADLTLEGRTRLNIDFLRSTRALRG